MLERCKICDRPAAEESLCKYHLVAKRNAVNAYRLWKEALGIPWKDYLVSLQKTPGCGLWVREVANHLLMEGYRYEGKV